VSNCWTDFDSNQAIYESEDINTEEDLKQLASIAVGWHFNKLQIHREGSVSIAWVQRANSDPENHWILVEVKYSNILSSLEDESTIYLEFTVLRDGSVDVREQNVE